MVNMGTRPTVQDDGITETMEVHLLEGGRQCYDETMELLFMARLRDEMMFEGFRPPRPAATGCPKRRVLS